MRRQPSVAVLASAALTVLLGVIPAAADAATPPAYTAVVLHPAGYGHTYGTGAAILKDLGIRRVRLITNNPAKYGGLGGHDLDIVGRVGLPTVSTPHNVRYLRTKKERMGHVLSGDPAIGEAGVGEVRLGEAMTGTTGA